MEPDTTRQSVKYLYIIIAVIAFVSAVTLYAMKDTLFTQVPKIVETEQVPLTEKKQLNQNIGDSLLRDKPKDLQDYFKAKIAKNENDSLSRAAIYFITHRFFDNGGDVYEIVDYIQSDSSLAFLEEAETVYPKIFTKILAREKLNKQERLLAYLAYLEILEKSGYADAAAYGTAASKYIELYDVEKSTKASQFGAAELNSFKGKSVQFAHAAQGEVETFISTNGVRDSDFSKDEMLVGMSQYAVALAFFKKYDISIDASYTYEEVFDFALNYATRNTLVLEAFTALNYNYALIIAGDASVEKSEKIGLGEIMKKTYQKTTYKKNGLIDKMMNGTALGYNVNGIYGAKTISKIIGYDAAFKEFMVIRGYKGE